MTESTLQKDDHYQRAIKSLTQTLEKLRNCSEEERRILQNDLRQLQDMSNKLTSGRVEIVVFGEISTGKSALINALVGREVAAVDVQGGWTKEIWRVDWEGAGYCIPGLADSQVVLVDTPGLNEVGGAARAEMAREAAQRADLILFATDSDLNETEFSALVTLASVSKPLIVVITKKDLYSPEQRARLLEVLRDDRLANVISDENIVMTAADPREVEYIIEDAKGNTRSEWRTPAPDVVDLKARILELLERDGLALVTLNAAMYAADKSDRIASLRVQLRDKKASQTIWSYAVIKAAVVALNPVGGVDTLGGTAVDATMVGTLAHIYGLQMSWTHARQLVASILKAAGWVLLAEVSTNVASMTFKWLTLGYGTIVTAVPQGAAAGYGSYIVGQAAKYYFEHGASWGNEGPKQVVRRILDETDKQSVLDRLKDEIRKKLLSNRYAGGK
ncbi:MAG TPA: GTP-binding protein [Pirellulaceae bacterium]|nr:GTP-binding protein [Pirellulaceae bacterium]